MKMHEGQVDVDPGLVAGLLAEQFPELAGLAIRRVRSTGTVNALFRLGNDLCARLPLIGKWSQSLIKELEWLPWLAERVSMRIPEPVAIGAPSSGYPFPWAIYRWIEGEPYADEIVDDERAVARALARFVRDLRAVELVEAAPPAGRRPLRLLDAETRSAIDRARGLIDGDATLAMWERSLAAPPWDGSPMWIHTDLLRPNLLVDDGSLRAVIDFGDVGVGDPAADVIAAWSVFNAAGRAVFRIDLDVDDDTWARARGYALHQAALIIPYYGETNPAFVTMARRTIDEILGEA
jgi:aminoglycoside phosphotransferase (APT) family kinase protein